LHKAKRDLTPLLDLPKLLRLRVSKLGKRLEPLRAHPSLQQIAYEEEPFRPVAEFWADYDVWKNLQEAREKNLAQVTAALPALGMAKGKTTIGEPWGVSVDLNNLPVADITGLRPLPIDVISLFETKVTNLAPLRGMRLKELSFAKTDVKDVSPLLDMPILEAATVTQGATNLGVLRQHPTLKWLGWEGDWDKDANRPKLTTAEFWARYDAQKAAGKK
jgi:hypothetical protein